MPNWLDKRFSQWLSAPTAHFLCSSIWRRARSAKYHAFGCAKWGRTAAARRCRYPRRARCILWYTRGSGPRGMVVAAPDTATPRAGAPQIRSTGGRGRVPFDHVGAGEET